MCYSATDKYCTWAGPDHVEMCKPWEGVWVLFHCSAGKAGITFKKITLLLHREWRAQGQEQKQENQLGSPQGSIPKINGKRSELRCICA